MRTASSVLRETSLTRFQRTDARAKFPGIYTSMPQGILTAKREGKQETGWESSDAERVADRVESQINLPVARAARNHPLLNLVSRRT